MTLPTGTSNRVVIIDDTEDLRDLLKLALGRGGFDVVGEAGDGRSGIEAVREQRPDVILVDLAMPIMDGIEALPSLRRLCPTAKIVVLSGFGAQQMSARAVAAGADGYVQKGAPLNAILDYVRDITLGPSGKTTSRKLSVVPTTSFPAVESPQEGRSTEPPQRTTSADESETASETETGTGPSAPTKEKVSTDTPEEQSHISAWEALNLAPYGVIELADEPLFRIVHANSVAARLLGTDKPGTPLGMVASELAAMVSFHRLDSDASFEVDLPRIRARASLRRTGWSILVYLDASSEDVATLRRAIATTAHEIRGPVAVLCGIAETIGWSSQSITPEQRNKLMGSVGRQAHLLDSITADLLTAAQIQRGTLRIDMQVVDPATVIEGALGDRYHARVSIEDPRQVRADPLRLEQMLTNLLSNAAKYGAEPYEINVRPRGEMVSIEVVDHGVGVPEEFADHLFTEFSRANDAAATGTGLGLFVVRTLAKVQNGDASYHPGKESGSVFVVKLLAC